MRSSLRLWCFLHSVQSHATGSAPTPPLRQAARGHLGPGPRRLRRWREALITNETIHVEEQEGLTTLQATLPHGAELRLVVKSLTLK